ncbi:MAG: hypothetical protein GY798_00530 [Hyphomicrobiales bacterium]|nr:hypothetical protein [Hyphomicrobiales bacterium]
MITDPDLWRRIKAHDIDDPDADFTFTDRLAAEQGWTRGFARRVIEEYRRFVYLACVGQREVTPSRQVDEAWHLHLTYTRDYWSRFCADVLGRPLHHGPTRGGEAEDRKYRDSYAATLAGYESEFGLPPDKDVWPPDEERFAPLPSQQPSYSAPAPPPSRGFIAALQLADPAVKWTIVGLVTLSILLAAFLALADPRAYLVAFMFAGFGGFLTRGMLFGFDRKRRKPKDRSRSSGGHIAGGGGGCGGGG